MEGHRIRAMSLTDVVAVVAITLLLIVLFAITYPSMRRRSYRSNGTFCAANMKGIGNGLATYAAGNNDFFPIPAYMPAIGDEVGRVRYAPGVIGTKRGVATSQDAGRSSEQDTVLSTTRVLWELVRMGAASPKSFICPSSDDVANDEDDPQNFWDFRKYSEVSYGFQVPFGKYGSANQNRDQDMVLAADKGSYSAALEAGKKHPGTPGLTSSDAPDKWMPFNSPNHDGEGQNVLYPDGHADFNMTPLAGWKKDNIYTRWSRADADQDANALARIQGTPPTGIETPWADTDSLIYP